ncbi:peptidylprolyl isomerase [Alkalicoccus luteus]|uniref:Peptidyl-prolyl cis-trans isomerase n=1 Tax=Alkalicoccus luteus TaxID=1237094 RepID=A0A969PRT1_9BACI|nr:peptidylprolyl isomerase [Alkalicoccus luteus]NJP37231.1 peptidylprolyl isomerase [Alkalicoccus luteus]
MKRTVGLLSLSIFLAACGSAGNENTAENEIEDNNQNESSDAEEAEEEEAEDVEESTVDMPQMDGDLADHPRAMLETSLGDIEIVFFPEQAPLAVENFFKLAKEDYYDGIIFHRVIEDFMIQGGDPTGTGSGGESAFGEPFEDEFDESLAHFRGAVSMANSGPNTNGSQFFIVHADETQLSEEMFEGSGFSEERVQYYLEAGGTPHLDGGHTVFGHVISGMDTVDEIAAVETEGADVPQEDVIIENVEILEAYED